MSARLLVGKDFQLTSTTFLQDVISSFLDNADKIALQYPAEGLKYTYRELHKKASGISAELHKLGVKDGDIVTIASPSTHEALIFIFGVWLSGAASACINPLVTLDEFQYFLKMNKSKVAFVGEAFSNRMQEAAEGLEQKIVLVSPNGKAQVNDYYKWTKNNELVTHVEQPLGKDHTVLICYTSGTTGKPKGAMIRDQFLKFCSHGLADIVLGEKILLSGPLFWISNPVSSSIAILKGFCIVQLNAPSPEEILQAITTYKPTFWFTGSSVVQELSRTPDLDKYDTSSLLRVIAGGSCLHSEQKRKIIEKVFGNRHVLKNGLGSTEAGPISLELEEYPFDSPMFSSLGQPMAGVTVKIVDTETGSLVGPNTPGEICVKSLGGQIKRYIDREVTDKELDKDGFWHLGDVGYYDEEGTIHYQARLRDMFKYREWMISPAELEGVIHSHPDVVESAVVGKPSLQFGELPTAFVVLKPGALVTDKELYDFIADKVIDQKRLRGGIYFVNSLPRNASGKLVKQELIKKLLEL